MVSLSLVVVIIDGCGLDDAFHLYVKRQGRLNPMPKLERFSPFHQKSLRQPQRRRTLRSSTCCQAVQPFVAPRC